MKKLTAILLIAILLFGAIALVACDDNNNPSGELPDYSNGDPAKKWYVSESPITLKVFYRDRLDYSIKNNDKSSASQIMKVIEEKCNVRFQWETAQWNMAQANTQFTTAIYSATAYCDLYVFTNAKLSAYGEIGAFYDYSKDYQTYCNSLYNIVNNDTENNYKAELTSIDNHMYVFPVFTAIKSEKMYLIRKDWLDACKADADLRTRYSLDFADMPETLDDFLNVCRAFKAKYGNQQNFYPFVFDNGLNGMNLFESFGIDMSISSNSEFFLEDGELKYGPTDSRAKEFVKFMRTMYEEHLIDPDYENNSSAADNYFEQGLAGISFGYGTKIDRYQQRIDALSAKNPNNANLKDADIQGFLPPKNGDDGEIQTRRQMMSISDSGGAAISIRTKYPREIMRIFDFVYSDEGQMLLNFGIQEGQENSKYTPTYKMVDGQPLYNENITNTTDVNGIALAPADAVRKYGMPDGFPTKQDIRYEQQVASQAVHDIREQYLAIMKDPVPNLKFTAFETQSISSDLTLLQQKYKTWLNGFIQGSRSINDNNWNQYINEMKALNLDTVVSIYNTAYNRYLQLVK